jgi:hypothetical protein
VEREIMGEDPYGAASGGQGLAPSERLLVWTFRRWAVGFRENSDHHWSLVWREFKRVFGASEAEPALAAFAGLFKQLMVYGTRPIHHHQPCCPCLGVDEAWLVGVVAACQHGRWSDARTLAEAVVDPDGAGGLLETASRLADGMRRRSLSLPLRVDLLARTGRRPASATVH